ncbi:MAG: hypothetical protein EZS28_053224, partial [Streblomastix strix]
MVQEHDSLRIATLDSPQRYYRGSAHRHRAQLQVSMIQTWIVMRNRKRNANEQKDSILSLRAALVIQIVIVKIEIKNIDTVASLLQLCCDGMPDEDLFLKPNFWAQLFFDGLLFSQTQSTL